MDSWTIMCVEWVPRFAVQMRSARCHVQIKCSASRSNTWWGAKTKCRWDEIGVLLGGTCSQRIESVMWCENKMQIRWDRTVAWRNFSFGWMGGFFTLKVLPYSWRLHTFIHLVFVLFWVCLVPYFIQKKFWVLVHHFCRMELRLCLVLYEM
jgi:hypothetical protein